MAFFAEPLLEVYSEVMADLKRAEIALLWVAVIQILLGHISE